MGEFGRIVVAVRRTRLQELLERFVTEGQARFYLERMGARFDEYERAHARYRESLSSLLAALPASPRHVVVERSLLPTFTFDERDLLITLGNNGLVVNAAKYLDGQPILGVNADPGAEESVVASFDVTGGLAMLPEVLQGRWRSKDVTLAEARLNDGQRLLAFNDLFIGQVGHTSARYRIEFDGMSEDQSSSGIIISTGAGSTGWMRSVFVGAYGVVGNGHSRDGDHTRLPGSSFDWSADELMFAVREPWPSRTTGTSVVAGRLARGETLRVVSRMPKDGVVFSDGVPEDAVAFNSGAIAEVRQSKKKARLVAR